MLVLKEGLVIADKPLKDHLDVLNNDKAFGYILDVVEGNIGVSEDSIKKIHSIIAADDVTAFPVGEYAYGQRFVSSSPTVPPPAKMVSSLIDQLLDRLPHSPSLADIAWFHLSFEDIHPFSDANGRCGRMLMNLMLMSEGYPPIVVKSDPVRIREYYRAFEVFCDPSGNRDITGMVAVMSEALNSALDGYLSVINVDPLAKACDEITSPAPSLAAKAAEARDAACVQVALAPVPGQGKTDKGAR
jgi:Fic family protein